MDPFENHSSSLQAPARGAAAVVPDDDAELAYMTRALYVGGAGDVSVRMADGQEVIFFNVPGGSVLPIRVVKVLAAGTTAGSMIALW